MATLTTKVRPEGQRPRARRYRVTVDELVPLYRDSHQRVDRIVPTISFETEALTPWDGVLNYADVISEEEAS